MLAVVPTVFGLVFPISHILLARPPLRATKPTECLFALLTCRGKLAWVLLINPDEAVRHTVGAGVPPADIAEVIDAADDGVCLVTTRFVDRLPRGLL